MVGKIRLLCIFDVFYCLFILFSLCWYNIYITYAKTVFSTINKTISKGALGRQRKFGSLEGKQYDGMKNTLQL